MITTMPTKNTAVSLVALAASLKLVSLHALPHCCKREQQDHRVEKWITCEARSCQQWYHINDSVRVKLFETSVNFAETTCPVAGYQLRTRDSVTWLQVGSTSLGIPHTPPCAQVSVQVPARVQRLLCTVIDPLQSSILFHC